MVEQMKAASMSPLAEAVASMNGGLAAQMSPISKMVEQMNAASMSPLAEAVASMNGGLAAQMSPISKMVEQFSPISKIIEQMGTSTASQLAGAIAEIDPDIWRSLVERAGPGPTVDESVDGEIVDRSTGVDAAMADALLGSVFIIVLYVLALIAVGQILANLAVVKMFLDVVHYEVARHPSVDGGLILWAVFGPTILKVLRSDGDPPIEGS
jgi:hypothetical protein